MSGRVAYLERTERGFRPSGLRLVSERSDDTFRCALEDPGADAFELARMADWVREHLPRSGAAALDILCLDVNGGLCSWITSPSAEPTIVAALARQGGADDWTSTEETSGSRVLGAYAGIAQDSSVQALAEIDAPTRRPFLARRAKKDTQPPRSPRQRMPVVAMPDAVARVLLDELDLRSIKVGSVCSLWHAMGAAWDPSAAHVRAGLPAEADGRIVADSPGIHATVLIDPSGRLLWSWSALGGLLAAGSMRLRSLPAADQPARAQVSASDLSRLAAEWLSWSAQLGAAPARVTCIIPRADPAEGALDAREIGETLGRAWPGALVDLAVDDDPIGATLRRLAVAGSAAQDSGQIAPLSPEDPTASLVALTHRPGRAHFRLYLWAALTLIVLAGGIAALAAQTWIQASRIRLVKEKTSEQWRTAFQGLKLPDQLLPGTELLVLRSELTRLDNERRPVAATEPAMPVLQELETLSFVIGYPGASLDEILLESRVIRPRVVCQVDSIAEGELLFTALKQIDGSNVTGWSAAFSPRQASGKFRCTFSGSWAATPRARTGGTGS